MTQPKSLSEALAAFQADLPKVHKGDRVNAGQRSYTFASLVDCTEAILPLLTKLGMSFTICPRRSDDGSYEAVGTLRHVTGGHIEGSLPLYGKDPQSIGSALTYARRYLLLAMTGVVADDDDDGAAAMQSPPTMAQRPPDPMVAAKNRVKAAWEALHDGVWDQAAATEHYASGNDGAVLADADAAALNAYAEALEARNG